MLKTKISFIASLINDENIVVDIGSDHAKLSQILVKENKAKKVINIEKNDGPLLNSINSTKSNIYYNRVWNIKSNGITEVSPLLFIDTCVIAGMGSNNIINILKMCKKHKIKRFIISPNNKIDSFRKWCRNNNFKINNESLIKDREQIYEIIEISKKGKYIPLSYKSITFGKTNLKNNDALFLEKWKNELLLIQSNSKKITKNKRLIREIKRILRNES